MALSPEAAELMELLDRSLPRRSPPASPAEVRGEMAAAAAAAPPAEPVPVGRVEERRVPGASGLRPARIYWPRESEDRPPMIVFIHGGGWVICDLDTHDETARCLCEMSSAIVVSIHPRYADEAPFPGPLEDCHSMVSWVAENAAELGGDPGRLALVGISSGGNLAAATTLACRDRGGPALARQLLIYPVIDNDFETGSYRENGEGYFLTTEEMRWYWRHYVGDPDAALDAYAAPGRATDLGGLPAARVVSAEHDPLRDEGERYARMLKDAGVEASLERYDGFHGFFTMPRRFEISRRAYEAEFVGLGERLRGQKEG